MRVIGKFPIYELGTAYHHCINALSFFICFCKSQSDYARACRDVYLAIACAFVTIEI